MAMKSKANSNAGKQSVPLGLWKERLAAEEKAARHVKPRPFAVNPHTIIVYADKPNNVNFESRCKPGQPILEDPFAHTAPSRFSETKTQNPVKAEEEDNIRAELTARLKKSMALPVQKHPFPMTTSQEYGWFERPLTAKETPPDLGGFYRGLKSSPVTTFVDHYTLNWGKSPFARTKPNLNATKK